MSVMWLWFQDSECCCLSGPIKATSDPQPWPCLRRVARKDPLPCSWRLIPSHRSTALNLHCSEPTLLWIDVLWIDVLWNYYYIWCGICISKCWILFINWSLYLGFDKELIFDWFKSKSTSFQLIFFAELILNFPLSKAFRCQIDFINRFSLCKATLKQRF